MKAEYKNGFDLKQKKDSLNDKMSEYRRLFSSTSNETERNLSVNEILKMEREVYGIDELIERHYIKARLLGINYLKEYKSGIYQGMVLNGNLKEHLLMMQEQTELQFDVLVEQMAEGGGVTEQLKGVNQMLWVQRMNNIRARAEEVVREWIFYI